MVHARPIIHRCGVTCTKCLIKRNREIFNSIQSAMYHSKTSHQLISLPQFFPTWCIMACQPLKAAQLNKVIVQAGFSRASRRSARGTQLGDVRIAGQHLAIAWHRSSWLGIFRTQGTGDVRTIENAEALHFTNLHRTSQVRFWSLSPNFAKTLFTVLLLVHMQVLLYYHS